MNPVQDMTREEIELHDRDVNRASWAIEGFVGESVRNRWIEESPDYLRIEAKLRWLRDSHAAQVERRDRRLRELGLPPTADRFNMIARVGKCVGVDVMSLPFGDFDEVVDRWANRRTRRESTRRLLPDLKPGVEGVVGEIVERKVLVGSARFRSLKLDLKDVAAEAFAVAMKRIAKHEPDKGSVQTLMETAVENILSTIARDRRRCLRGERAEAEAARTAHVRGEVHREDMADLKEELARVLKTMTDDDRELIRALASAGTPAAAARELGIPGATFDYRLKRIRERHSQESS
ncbi:MAG: hypothetical protein JNM94_15400 [Phycisphaerae bacterium]|nr:hypothetical protein [Phycisphaerae bacterium]